MLFRKWAWEMSLNFWRKLMNPSKWNSKRNKRKRPGSRKILRKSIKEEAKWNNKNKKNNRSHYLVFVRSSNQFKSKTKINRILFKFWNKINKARFKLWEVVVRRNDFSLFFSLFVPISYILLLTFNSYFEIIFISIQARK